MNKSLQQTSSSGMWTSGRTAVIVLLLAYFFIYILALGHRPMAIPDESRYGEIPREMLVTGDWAVPHLIGLRYFEKPPMGYWLNAISISLFGENNFAVRLPSALATGLTAFFIWLLLIRSGYGQRAAIVAAAVYLSIAEVLIVGMLAVLDNPFTLFLSGGMVLFYLATRATDASRQQRWYLLGTGVLFGLAFLSKGFLAIVLPGLVLVPYCLLQKRYKLLFQQSWWVVLSTLLTVLPWAIVIHLREPDFWHYFIWEEHIRRFLAKDAQHVAPAYAYVMMLPAAMFPWLAFVPAALMGFRLNKAHADLLRYVLLWFALPFLFFSVSKGKLATYILPCMIPAAILVGVGILNYIQSGRRRLLLLGVALNTLLLLVGLILLLQNQYLDDAQPIYTAAESTKAFVMTGGLVLAIVLNLVAGVFKDIRISVPAIAASMAIGFFLLNLSLPNSMLENKSPNALLEQVATKLKPDTMLVSDANLIRAIAWTFKRTDIYLVARGELGYGLSYPEHADRMLGITGLRKLLAQQKVGEFKRDIAVFCELPCHPDMMALFNEQTQRYTTDVFSVWQIPYVP